MIQFWDSINFKESELELKGDDTGEKPLYLYLTKDRKKLFSSTEIQKLLDLKEVREDLKISPLGISFFLQSGVIPPPFTIYENLFVLNIGDRALVKKQGENIEISFYHLFPYKNSLRKGRIPNEKFLLDLLFSAVKKRLKDGEIYLFQSLGKDSNTILLALVEGGFAENLTCLTLSTGDRKDESEVAKKIATKLGVRHQKLFIPKVLTVEHWQELEFYFRKISLPCADGVSLAYPFYALQIDFKKSNIIDGSGVDIYFGHVPRPIEYKRQKIYPFFYFLRPLAEWLSTGNFLQKLCRTRAEMIGLIGFTYSDTQKIYPEAIPVYSYWKNEELKRKNWDYFDIKADLWGTKAEYDLVIKKVRNFAEVYNANLILPWTDKEVINYVFHIDEKYLFDRKNFKNKLILRKILKEKLDLDADQLGKYSYGFDPYPLIKTSNKTKEIILECPYWAKRHISKLLKKIEILAEEGKNKLFRNLYVRLFLLSAFLTLNERVPKN
ncbi:MAG: asparagine synthase-related protein [Caldimicrobium sp.]|jgi:asparagine synthase (glutamine-hydrolysing)